MPIKLNSAGGGSVTLDVPSTGSTYTLKLPAVTANVLSDGATITVPQGGTGLSSLTTGLIPFGNGTGALSLSSNLYWSGSQLYLTANSNPALVVQGLTTSNVTSDISINRSGSGNSGVGQGAAIQFNNSTTSDGMFIQMGANATFQIIQNPGNSGWTERMRIDNNGNVGIGTTSPNYKLEMAVTSGANFISATSNVTGQDIGYRLASTATSGREYRIQTSDPTRGSYGAGLVFVDVTASSARMIIDVNGNLMLNTAVTNPGGATYSGQMAIAHAGGTSKTGIVIATTSSAASKMIEFTYTGYGAAGVITTTTSATSYGTSSDISLKTNISPAASSLSSILALPIRQFDWKIDGFHTDYGVVAQEAYEYAPEMVSKGVTEDDLWSVDYGRLTPRLVKAIQELKADLDATKAELAALKNK